MSITRDTINALQTKLSQVVIQTSNSRQTVRLKAPEIIKYPTNITTANLPLAMTWPGPSSFDFEGIGGGKRRFVQGLMTMVFMQPLGQNDVPSRVEEAIMMLDAVRNVLLDNTAIIDGQYQVTLAQSLANPHRDSGLIASLQFGGTMFFGFTIETNMRILRQN
jgi:hypothetical protein